MTDEQRTAPEKEENELPQAGEVVELTIDALSFGADAIGRTGGVVCFVEGGVPGDVVKVEIIEQRKRFLKGRLLEVVTPSEHRVDPFCPVFETCGGCQWQMVSSAYQKSAKRQAVVDALARIGGLETPVAEATIELSGSAYRTRTHFRTGMIDGKLTGGYYARKSHRIVPVEECPLNTAPVNSLLASALKIINHHVRKPDIRTYLKGLYARQSRSTGLMLLTIESSRRIALTTLAKRIMRMEQKCAGVWLSYGSSGSSGKNWELLAGSGELTEKIGDVELRVSGRSFFQVHAEGADALLKAVRELGEITQSDRIVDAYGGVGLFALTLAKNVKSVTLIERDRHATADAAATTKSMGITNVSVVTAPVEEGIRGVVADLVILDPPREGCSPAALDGIVSTGADRIIYVSCDPTALARDAKSLGEAGYRLTKTLPIDQFAATFHIETVARFDKET